MPWVWLLRTSLLLYSFSNKFRIFCLDANTLFLHGQNVCYNFASPLPAFIQNLKWSRLHNKWKNLHFRPVNCRDYFKYTTNNNKLFLITNLYRLSRQFVIIIQHAYFADVSVMKTTQNEKVILHIQSKQAYRQVDLF